VRSVLIANRGKLDIATLAIGKSKGRRNKRPDLVQ
jgi:hypothetical protein